VVGGKKKKRTIKFIPPTTYNLQPTIMKLGIYSLKKILFQGEAVSVNCQTTGGEITVLDNHRPLITILKKGVLKIIDKDKKEHYIPISSGFLEVNSKNQTRLIVDEDQGG